MDRSSITSVFIKKELNRKVEFPKVNLNYEEIINSNIGYLVMNKIIPYEMISKEIKNIESFFVPHRAEFDESLGWEGFCLHGKSYDATKEDSYYNDNRSKDWTSEALDLMPNTVNFFKNDWFGNTFNRLRIMKLLPNGYINCHSDDKKPGYLSPVNIAITNPSGNIFAMENCGIVPFVPGRAIMLNVSNFHAVRNESNEPRYHIIVHHNTITDSFKQLVVESYKLLF